MRYLKLLILVSIFILSLVFCFQNQAALSQNMELKLNLFFLDPMSSIPLPLYFLIFIGFFAGVVLTLAVLIWDKLRLSARLMKNGWYIKRLEEEVKKLNKQLGKTPSQGFFRKLWKQSTEKKTEDASLPESAPQPAKTGEQTAEQR